MIADPAMAELFREEIRSHTDTLSAGLLELEASPADQRALERLMRAAHSIKGAARIARIDPAVGLAHVMEDAFVAAQEGRIRLDPAGIDLLLRGTDVLAGLREVNADTVADWSARHAEAIASLSAGLEALARGTTVTIANPARLPKPLPSIPAAERPARAVPVIPAEPLPLGEEHTVTDLFREEVRANARLLVEGLPRFDDGRPPAAEVERLTEAAQAIKGAGRIAGVEPVAALAGAIELVLVAVRDGRADVGTPEVDRLLRAVALLAEVVPADDGQLAIWAAEKATEVAALCNAFRQTPQRPAGEKAIESPAQNGPVAPAVAVAVPAVSAAKAQSVATPSSPVEPGQPAEAVVRVTARSLNRLMGLAGESLVQARWLQPFATSLQKLKKHQDHLAGLLDQLEQALGADAGERPARLAAEARQQAARCRHVLGDRIGEFEDHAARADDLNSRLYHEVIVSRMRPFADGAHGFPRLVRDMARALGKQARFELVGPSTRVDRDVLDRLEAALTHLLRNAVDHGLEPPEARQAAGKSEAGCVRVEARHRAGMLAITVSDDGAGIDVERLRRVVVERGLAGADVARGLGEAELLEFLFLPGFSTARAVSEYSGRGVGLDVVHEAVRQVGGTVRVTTAPGRGTQFHLLLPITLSVLRAVVVTIAGEPYAFPHNRIDRLVRVPRDQVNSLENRPFVAIDGRNIGLVLAAQVLELPADVPAGDELSVVLVSDAGGHFGLIVDAFRGEQDLVVRPLDERLGKVPDVSAAAVLDDSMPVLILDVEDLIRSTDQFVQTGSLRRCDRRDGAEAPRKRVLVVDDSITVREVERQLLRSRGYDVAVAVDGRDGWNAVRAEHFDLVVTDVDMPRMDGLELVRAVRAEPTLRDLPVIIVSYKDRQEDRMRGLEAGATHYLTKGSFHDNTFLQAVADLIGEA